MADLAKLVVSLEAETAKYRRGLDSANRKLDQFAKRQQKQLDLANRAWKRFGGAVAAVFSVAVLRQGIRLADTFAALNTRVRTATRLTGDFVQVQKELLDTAISTGAAFETTVDTFQALARVRNDIGATTDQLLTFNRTIQQLGVIGGSTTQQMNDGLRQLNQGLAAGTFRAEEFNSIVENTPEIAARLAQGLGITQGQLRQLVIDGKLLSSTVFETLLKQSVEIGEQFKGIPPTIERSTNSLSTAIGSALSVIDEATGFTSGLASAIQDLADAIQEFAKPTTLGALKNLREETSQQLSNFRHRGTPRQREIAGNLQTRLATFDENIALLESAQTQQTAGVATSALTGGGAAGGGEAPEFRGLEGIGLFAEAEKELNEEIMADIESQTSARNAGLAAVTQSAQEAAKEIEAQNEAVRAQADEFSELFRDNMVEAAQDGFDGVLALWIQTLQQMALKAAGTRLFEALFPTGIGPSSSGLGGIIGSIFGFAEGGVVPGPMGRPQLALVHGGETVTPPGQVAGGFTQNIYVPLTFPPQLDAHVRNVAGQAGANAAMKLLNAQNGRI